MQISRRFTQSGKIVFDSIEWTKRASRISNPDGSVVFEMNDAEIPTEWSQLATDIMVSKYFRKAGVPQFDSETGEVIKDDEGNIVTGPERSAKQVVNRLAGCWRYWGEKHGYFNSAEDAQTFSDEISYMLITQMCAPNSPQWFNTGLNWAYDITGPAQGHWITDPVSGETQQANDAYSHPQPHACFIQSVDDDLVNPGGIMDLWVREARLFKYGSGTGSNFSQLRGESEPLSGGGKSSGLMSWLKIGDRAAGAIKSGGTTRRAAKMVCLDLDHPDVKQFINWKVREEIKVAALVEGLKNLPEDQKETAAALGLELEYDFNGEAYMTVSGQNSNNSIRIPNEFFNELDAGEDWELRNRTNGEVESTVPAKELWDTLGYAAWRCADPGVQFDTTINEWHTCPEGGRINASNPCSEYMFLDNTACNLASLNLIKFYDKETKTFDLEGFEHGVRLWTIVLEISVLMAAFPSKDIARLSYEYRTLGLGYANIGAMLMQAGIPYDSETARAICGSLTAILTGRSYATSAEMASEHGPFPGYYKNRDHMLRVIRNHRRAAYGVSRDNGLSNDLTTDPSTDQDEHGLGDYEGLQIKPVPIDSEFLEGQEDGIGQLSNSDELLRNARVAWDDALRLGEASGFRNAQTTVIAPTGTIGLLMDCDTTGVEPDFALVKFKKLAGGGYFKIANQSLKPALQGLGYTDQQITDIMHYVLGKLSFNVPMPDVNGEVSDDCETTFADVLKEKNLEEDVIAKLTDSLGSAMELSFVFNPYTLGQDAIERLGLNEQTDVLNGLGFSRKQIDKLNEVICGTGTVEGAPHLQDEHLAIFDCANKCGKSGKRFIDVQGHIRMMATAQPFLSGAISKTINLPNEATVENIKESYRLSWELGLKANALYRDGCKLSQVLNSTADVDDEIEDDDGIEASKEEVANEVAQVADRISTVNADVADKSKAAMQPVERIVERVVERIVERPLRRRLPDTRRSTTHKFNVAGHEGYLTVGLYDDGNPGELFITMAKEGSTIGGIMDSLGTAISVALQYGVPIESLVNKFTHQRFEPAGMTHNPDIPFAKSLVDYIFRWMGMEFIPGYRAANAPQRTKPKETTDKASPSSVATSTSNPSSTGSTTPRAKIDSIVDPKRKSASAELPATPSGSNGNGGNGSGVTKSRAADVQAHDRMTATTSSASISTTERIQVVTTSPQGLQQTTATSSFTAAMRDLQADAPACDACGEITVRSGTCYKCLNCGASMGCS